LHIQKEGKWHLGSRRVPSPLLGGSLTQEIKACRESSRCLGHSHGQRQCYTDSSKLNLVERQVIQEGKRGVGSIVREVRMTKGKHQQESLRQSLLYPHQMIMMKSKYSITVKVHLTEKVPFQEPRMQQTQEAIRWYPATLQLHHASLCGLFQPFRKARLGREYSGYYCIKDTCFVISNITLDKIYKIMQREAEKRHAIQDSCFQPKHYRDSHRDH
jgi:hypothetical protein